MKKINKSQRKYQHRKTSGNLFAKQNIVLNDCKKNSLHTSIIVLQKTTIISFLSIYINFNQYNRNDHFVKFCSIFIVKRLVLINYDIKDMINVTGYEERFPSS